jgi:hypothetical protein
MGQALELVPGRCAQTTIGSTDATVGADREWRMTCVGSVALRCEEQPLPVCWLSLRPQALGPQALGPQALEAAAVSPVVTEAIAA